LTGEPVALAEQVGIFNSDGFFSASANGGLLYRGGRGRQASLTWFDRQGKSVRSALASFDVASLSLSPDATRVAVGTFGSVNNIWLYDFARSTNTRLPSGESWPVNVAFPGNGR
jgi:hypothetical protein